LLRPLRRRAVAMLRPPVEIGDDVAVEVPTREKHRPRSEATPCSPGEQGGALHPLGNLPPRQGLRAVTGAPQVAWAHTATACARIDHECLADRAARALTPERLDAWAIGGWALPAVGQRLSHATAVQLNEPSVAALRRITLLNAFAHGWIQSQQVAVVILV